MSFRTEVQKILLNNKPLERKLNAIESAHKRHRNIEIANEIQKPLRNTVLSKLIHRGKIDERNQTS